MTRPLERAAPPRARRAGARAGARPGRRRAAPRRRRGPKVLRYAFRVAETELRPGKINDLYSRTVTPHIFEALYSYDHLARPIKVKPLTADGDAEVSDDFRTWTVKIQPGIFFADDPAFKGKPRELVAAGLRLRLQALRRPGQQEPGRGPRSRTRSSSAWPSCARRRSTSKQAVRLRPRDRGPARARPLHAAVQARRAAPALHRDPRRRRPVRRGRARGRRVLRRADRRPSGRHRPVQARAVAAQLAASCSSATPTSARCSTTPSPPPTTPRARRSWRASRAGGCRWSTGSRSRSSRRSSRAGCPSSTARPTSSSASAAEFIDAGDARRQGRAEPGQARHPRLPRSSSRTSRCCFFNMEDPVVGGYTPEKVALRRAICLASTSSARSRTACARPGDPGAVAVLPHTSGYDPEFAQRDRRVRPGARARRCSTCTATSTATATAGASSPTASRWCSSSRPSPTSARASSTSCWTKNMDALGMRVSSRRRSGRRT